MNRVLKEIRLRAKRWENHLKLLSDLFEEMDSAYTRVARLYGFRCDGCADNCCETRFFHHTLLEYLYVYAGFQALDEKARAAVIDKAGARKFSGENPARVMCPLNESGRCLVYDYRPMICRLHGIPHELKRSGGTPALGPGCDEFEQQCGMSPYISFDRTPLYRKMALLEKDLREGLGFENRLKMTIAEMIQSWAKETGRENS
jgi:Fe-S-cluster containining protein